VLISERILIKTTTKGEPDIPSRPLQKLAMFELMLLAMQLQLLMQSARPRVSYAQVIAAKIIRRLLFMMMSDLQRCKRNNRQ
jgi:hypothetical protein